MNVQRVVSKEQLVKVLLAGGKIQYDLWEAKPYLYEYDTTTQSYNMVGTVRFDTYLKLNFNETSMKLKWNEPDASPFCKVRRPDPWCGYDTFKLRPEFLEIYNKFKNSSSVRKSMEASLWRK